MRIGRRVSLSAGIGIAAMLASSLIAPVAADAGTAGLPHITVTMNAHSITLSSGGSVHAGRVIFTVRSGDGAGHSLQLFKLRNGYTLAQFKKDRQALDGSSNPAPVRRVYAGVNFLGGTQSGHSFSETLYTGRYFLFDSDGAAPNLTTLDVHGTPPTRAWPGDGSVITAHDLSFSANETIPGTGWTLFRNVGDEPHFLSMVRVKPTTTRAMVKKALMSQTEGQPSWMLGPGVDIGVVSSGAQILFRHGLPAGKYLILCFMPDPDHHNMPHALMGMYNFVHMK